MKTPRSILRVSEAFERLPGIGSKTASRLAYYLLRVPQTQLDQFASAVVALKKDTHLCNICMNLDENDPCSICANKNRDASVICVVEQPLDIVAIETTGVYKGLYHVLHGVVAPLDHIGPDEIYISQLVQRVKTGIDEVILALNPTMEGEATALYIRQEIEKIGNEGLVITRLAQGLPLGGDVEYADSITLGRALEGRRGY